MAHGKDLAIRLHCMILQIEDNFHCRMKLGKH
jgi:hypothetical protein